MNSQNENEIGVDTNECAYGTMLTAADKLTCELSNTHKDVCMQASKYKTQTTENFSRSSEKVRNIPGHRSCTTECEDF